MGQCLGLVAKPVVPAAEAEDEAVDGSALLNPVIMADVSLDSLGDPTCHRPEVTMRDAEVAFIEEHREELVAATTEIKLERVVKEQLAPLMDAETAEFFKVCVSFVCYYSQFLLFPLSAGAPIQWVSTTIRSVLNDEINYVSHISCLAETFSP